jgi:hypothetical protein
MVKAGVALKYFAYVSAYKVDQLYDQLVALRPDRVRVGRSHKTDVATEAGLGKLLSFLTLGAKASHSRGTDIEVEGAPPLMQKLDTVLKHINENEVVMDLNTLCERRQGDRLDALAYTYSGPFTAFATLNRRQPAKFFDTSGDVHISGKALAKGPDTIVLSRGALLEPALKENSHSGPPGASMQRVSNIALLYSQAGEYLIELACSLKYFSDMGGARRESASGDEWEVVPHSGNHRFFQGEVDAYFDALIFITDVRGDNVFGTPLFLAFAPNPDLHI